MRKLERIDSHPQYTSIFLFFYFFLHRRGTRVVPCTNIERNTASDACAGIQETGNKKKKKRRNYTHFVVFKRPTVNVVYH